jgi:hypothetical protein
MFSSVDTSLIAPFFSFLWRTFPFWGVVLFGILAWRLWVTYVNQHYLNKLKWTLLEIKVPKEVTKSPAAMELVLQALYQSGGVGTWYAKYWLGKLLAWFSLEIVSIEGNVYFFIRCEQRFKDIIEAQIYSQYPQAEVTEVEDYTAHVPRFTRENSWELWGCEMKLAKADPYPIKTYIDYGLDRATGLDENQKIDPMTPLIEFLGSLQQGEQVWIQIPVRASVTTRWDKTGGSWFPIYGTWIDQGREEIKKLAKANDIIDPATGNKIGGVMNMTKGQKDVIEAIERSLNKPGFDAGIRAIYYAKKDRFNGMRPVGILGAFRQFNSTDLNAFKVGYVTDFDYPWEDYHDIRKNIRREEIFTNYVTRSYFYPPASKTPFVLNIEELATIFHFPGQVSETPTFERIEASKGEPPANLPIG